MTILNFLQKIHKLSSAEIETLNILLDDKARNALFVGLEEKENREVISLSQLFRD